MYCFYKIIYIYTSKSIHAPQLTAIGFFTILHTKHVKSYKICLIINLNKAIQSQKFEISHTYPYAMAPFNILKITLTKLFMYTRECSWTPGVFYLYVTYCCKCISWIVSTGASLIGQMFALSLWTVANILLWSDYNLSTIKTIISKMIFFFFFCSESNTIKTLLF